MAAGTEVTIVATKVALEAAIAKAKDVAYAVVAYAVVAAATLDQSCNQAMTLEIAGDNKRSTGCWPEVAVAVTKTVGIQGSKHGDQCRV